MHSEHWPDREFVVVVLFFFFIKCRTIDISLSLSLSLSLCLCPNNRHPSTSSHHHLPMGTFALIFSSNPDFKTGATRRREVVKMKCRGTTSVGRQLTGMSTYLICLFSKLFCPDVSQLTTDTKSEMVLYPFKEDLR